MLAWVCALSPAQAQIPIAEQAWYHQTWADTATIDALTVEDQAGVYLGLGQAALLIESQTDAARAAKKLGGLLLRHTPSPATLAELTDWLEAFSVQYGSRAMVPALVAGLTQPPPQPALVQPGEVLLTLTRHVLRTGRRWVAISLATAALEPAFDAAVSAEARVLLAQILRRVNQADAALIHLAALHTTDPGLRIQALALRADLALDRSEPDQAQAALSQARPLLTDEHISAAADYARASARLELTLGHLAEAATFAQEADRLATLSRDSTLILGALKMRIRVLGHVDFQAALAQFERLLAITDTLPADDWIEGLVLLVDLLEHKLARLDWTRDSEFGALVLSTYALYDQGLERTLATADAALGTTWTSRPAHLARLGTVRSALHQARAAEAAFSEALSDAYSGDNPHRAFVHRRVADHHARQGRLSLAIWHGKQAVDHLQTMRARLTHTDAFVEHHRPVYVALADRLIQQGRLPEAQQVLDLLKRAELRDYTRTERTSDRATRSAREQVAERRIRIVRGPLTQLAHRAGRLRRRAEAALAGGAPLTQAERAEHAAATEQLAAARTHYRAAMEYVEDQLLAAGRRAAVTDRALPQLHTLQALVAQLGPKVALLHVVVTPQRVNLILTTARTQTAHTVAVKVGTLNQEVHALQRALRNPNTDPSGPAQALYRRLISPIRGELNAGGVNTLMVSLDAALRYIPMAALRDPGSKRYLAQDFTLTRYGATARETLSQPYQAPQLSVTALGTTQAHGTLNALPGVATELERIVRHGPKDQGIARGTIALDGAFTRGALRAALSEGLPKVHVATHFVFKPGTDADSYLLLGDGTHLSMAALRTERFDFGEVDLLTVSACETAVGLGEDGRELDGFGALIQAQGARAVLATLWPVADEGTAEFMDHFYTALAAGQGRAAALHTAQVAFIEGRSAPTDGSTIRGLRRPVAPTKPGAPRSTNTLDPHQHPYYWAPFILMGDWR